MAGFRDFQTGEVLTAANVNDFLSKQSVMKFADAAARNTALGTAVGGSNALREGMVAYLDDTDELLKYDGTAWATIGNAGIGSNAEFTTLTSTFSTASTSATDITGLSVTLTPTSASSKILVFCSVAVGSSVADYLNLRINDQSDGILFGSRWAMPYISGNGVIERVTLVAVQTPGNTTARTYQAVMYVQSGTGVVNRRGVNADVTSQSTIAAIEVAG